MNTFLDSNPTKLGESTKLIRVQTLARKLEGAKILGTIPIKVKRYYTTVDGTVLLKTDPTIPAALLTDFPVYSLGEFDRQGGFKIGGLTRPPKAGCYYIMQYIKGSFVNPLIDFSTFNDVNNYISTGDLVTIYSNSPSNPTTFVYIVQSIAYAGLGSILSDTIKGSIQADSISFYADNTNQFAEQLYYIKGKVIGTYKQDNINPLTFKGTQQAQSGFIDILVDFDMNEYFGINFYMLFDTNEISLNIKIKHL